MSFRRAFTLGSILVLALALLGSFSIISITLHDERIAERLERAQQGAHAAQQIHDLLLKHQRERAVLTSREEHEVARRALVAEVEAWFSVAQDNLNDDEEAHLLAQARAELAHYQEAWQSELGNTASRLNVNDELEAAENAVIALVEDNIAQANAARHERRQWDAFAEVLGGATAGILVLSAVGGIAIVRGGLYRRLLSLRDAMAEFDVGRSDRLDETGPRELADLARGFNAMADTLREKRRTQLHFLAAVAHDLRTPVHTLRLATEAAEQNPGDVDRTHEIVRRQLVALERMADDLLDLARIEAGELHLRPRRVDLTRLLSETVAVYQQASRRHCVHVRSEPELVAMCDPDRVGQVLHNLLSNAVKYSPNGGDIDIQASTEAGEAVVSITDHGVGIEPAEQERVFEPFRRSKRHEHMVPGVGLGLSVARRIIEAHGGRLDLSRSVLGEGSTFRIRLPLLA